MLGAVFKRKADFIIFNKSFGKNKLNMFISIFKIR